MIKPIGHKRAGEILDSMSNFEIARWQALMDAIEILNEKCEDKKQDFNKLDIKPKAVEKFIESTCDIYCRNIERQRDQEAIIKHNQEINIFSKLMHVLNEVDV